VSEQYIDSIIHGATIKFCGHNSEFPHFRDDGSYMYHFALKE